MRKYVTVGATAAAALAGLVVLAAPASAHANAVTGSAMCQSDGTYTVTWTIANDFNLTETATVTAHTPDGSTLSASSVDIATTPATGTVVQSGIAGDYTGLATLNVHGVWSDGYGNKPGEGLASGSVQLSGSCTQSVPVPGQPVPTEPTCLADGSLVVPGDTVQVHWSSSPSGTGPGTYTLTATAQTGYSFADGSSSQQFTETVLPKLGSDSEACVSHVTVPAPVFTNGDCATAPTLTGATDGVGYTAAVVGTPGFGNTVVVTFTARPGYRLDGESVYTFSYAAKPDCTTAASPVNPGVTQATCDPTTGIDSGFTITPATTDGISYTVKDLVVTATAKDGFTLGTLPAGWTSVSETVASYTVTRTDPLCAIAAIAVSPAFTADVCQGGVPAGASLTVPETTGVDYFLDGTATAAGTHPATDGSTVIVTARAKEGFTLTGTTSWSHTFSATPTCAEVGAVTIIRPPAQQPVVAAATVPLAATGVPAKDLLLIGGLLLLGGAAMCFGGRRLFRA